jgi:virulence-associated protein VapD
MLNCELTFNLIDINIITISSYIQNHETFHKQKIVKYFKHTIHDIHMYKIVKHFKHTIHDIHMYKIMKY